jgi:hypothetical protein
MRTQTQTNFNTIENKVLRRLGKEHVAAKGRVRLMIDWSRVEDRFVRAEYVFDLGLRRSR